MDQLETKKCKQCGRVLSLNNFRKYTPRGKGIYKTKVGHNTVCLACEQYNKRITKIWRKPANTLAECNELEEAATLYRALSIKKLEPVGAYARHVLKMGKHSIAEARQRSSVLDTKTYKDMLMQEFKNKGIDSNSIESLQTDFSAILAMDFVDDPDTYEAMIDEIVSRCPKNSDGKVILELSDIYAKVLDKHAVYEDSYWEEH